MNEELFIEELKKANDKYFKTHFLNKDIDAALYNAFVNCLKMLLKTNLKFVFLENSIITVKNNKAFWEKTDKKTKESINIILKEIKMINYNIENLLLPISEYFSLDKNSNE